MGLLDFLHVQDINDGLKAFQSAEGAVLFDVRTPKEYGEGHIPESKNVPLNTIDDAVNLVRQ